MVEIGLVQMLANDLMYNSGFQMKESKQAYQTVESVWG